MPNYFIESFQEFKQRMGCPFITLPESKRVPFRDGSFADERYLFENAGLSDGNRHHIDPPQDPGDVARLQHLYHSTLLDAKRNEHQTLLQKVSTQNDFHRSGYGQTAEEIFPGWQDYLE